MDLGQLKLTSEKDQPFYLQLYHRYREAIAAGQLRPGDRVPSVRSLASELNLARGTVEVAYQMLTSEGYFLSRGPAGTVVSPWLKNPAATGPMSPSSAPPVQRAAPEQQFSDEIYPFQLGLPALDAFPHKTWARLTNRRLRSLDHSAMIYPDPSGYRPLRHAIASYLGISRGVVCREDQVFVTAGYRGALALICRTLLQQGDQGWFEDPGYLFARQYLQRSGLQLMPVPVDNEGLNVAAGLQLAANARFALVTPTHQSPTGVTLSLSRRLELLQWANQQQAWIIEDDYDSEFRYHGRPLPALKSLDHQGRVLYAGTFSKVLFPGLNLAYLVVPEAQIASFKAAAAHLPYPGSMPQQGSVADFIEQGYFARHLSKMRSLYAKRRVDLVNALQQVFGERLQVQPQAGGIHLLARLAEHEDDQALAAAAQHQGLAVQALSDWRTASSAGASQQPGLVMGFSNIESPAMALALALRLKAALD